MLRSLANDADNILLACGPTDFRKQIPGLVALVDKFYNLDPYDGSSVFIFCNKKRNSIKVLRFDKNGFILATKQLLEDMKFQWPKKVEDIKNISYQQIEWLLQGLEIEQKKALPNLKISNENTCF